MWTYLAIFLSVSVLVLVFARRVYLFAKTSQGGKEQPLAPKKVKEEEGAKAKAPTKKELTQVEELCKKADSSLKAGKEDEAIKLFVQALAIDELHAETQHKLAMLYMKKQMFRAAAALFKSLGEATEEAVHYSHLGLALYQQNLYEDALGAYQRAVDLDPSRAQRFVSLAQVYRALGQLQNAIIALNKALEMEEENLDYLFLLVDVQAELGNFDEAIELVNRLIEIDPKNAEAKEH